MIALVVFVLALVLLSSMTVYFFGVPLSPVVITGKVVETTGLVRIYVEGGPKVITIYSPENTTYDDSSYTCATGSLPKCDNYRYILSLNVSADFWIEDSDGANPWKYSLYDLKHSNYTYEDVVFTPNTTVAFVRWGNVLTVFAEEKDADWVNNSVVFTIEVPNSAPLIQNFTEKMFVCETDKVNALAGSHFNVYDIDEEEFNVPMSNYRINEGGVFGISSFAKTSNFISPLQIVSVYFGKAHLRDYIVTIDILDGEPLTDSKTTNITVIEINNAPVMEDISANTVEKIYFNGTGNSFNHQVSVVDTEDGVSSDGNMIFNLTWFVGDLGFSINSTTGVMNYTVETGTPEGTYWATVCVTDNALASVHENFSVCSDRGYGWDNQSDCDSFSLTVTSENRVPVIESYFPTDTNFSVPGTTTSLFSVSVSDADMVNSYPDIDWYVDGVLKESNENLSTDDYSYAFGCGVSGNHNVAMITSDGLANVSQSWDISVTNVACPVAATPSGGGGGGGGGGTLGGVCNERWSCHGWGLCQNAERSFDAGALSPEDYASTKDLCAQNLFDDRFCGFQITRCFDLAMCNNTEARIPKPVESRVCYFTENPNCIDGITNCHDGDCELLVDCGGPCGPCPTCSDGKRNQGEKGVDCGGPCPFACEDESPFGAISFALVGLLLLLLVVSLYILYKVFKIIRHRFFLVGKKRKKEDK